MQKPKGRSSMPGTYKERQEGLCGSRRVSKESSRTECERGNGRLDHTGHCEDWGFPTQWHVESLKSLMRGVPGCEFYFKGSFGQLCRKQNVGEKRESRETG